MEKRECQRSGDGERKWPDVEVRPRLAPYSDAWVTKACLLAIAVTDALLHEIVKLGPRDFSGLPTLGLFRSRQ